MSSILRSSKFVRYFVGLARNIVISNRQEVDGSLLQRSQHLAGVLSSYSSSPSLQTGASLDRTIKRLDEDARMTGRLSVKEIEDALNEIRQLRKASTSQSLMVIRCCGNLVPEEAPEHRTRLVNEIWNTLEKLGVSLDISHYNALLKVYLENEHKFSPTEFLAKLEKQGIEPNRVTYQRLIAGFCQIGDIAGATKILEFMKEKQIPVNEGVFNALILGHYQADDIESAEGILSVMKQANLEPSSDTYTTLLCGYAKRGDKEAVERIITDCKVKDVLLSDRDILEVAYTAAINGHEELVDEMLNNVKHMTGYNQEAANFLLRLMTRGKDEAAYKVFSTMQKPVLAEGTPNMSGHLIVKQMIKTNRSVDEIVNICEKLKKDGHTHHGLGMAVEASFHHGNIDLTLGLLKVLKEKHEPIRNHYFWPSLNTAGKTGNINRLNEILTKMVSEFDLSPNSDTLIDYYLPFTESKNLQENLKTVLDAGVSRTQAVRAFVFYLISQNKLQEAVKLALQKPAVNLRGVLVNRLLVDALQQTQDVKSVVSLVHIMMSNPPVEQEKGEEEEDSSPVEDIGGKFLLSLVSYSQTRKMVADVLKEMVECGLGISNAYAETVESRLQGNQLTTEISELLAKLSSGDLSPTPLKRTASSTPVARNPVALERIKERIKANNESKENLIGILRSLFNAYCYNNDLENALKIKQEWVEELKLEVTPGWWAILIDVYCNKGDLEKVKECLENIKNASEFELDTSKVLKVAKLYIENNLFNDAIDFLKSVKPREERGFISRAAAWQTLQAAAVTTKDPERVKELFNILLEQKYIEVNNVNLGPLIKVHLLNDDIEGALKEFERCVQLYRATPWKNELAARLIEMEDPVKLQTLVDLSTQIHGEINSLYDLVMVFVECGRIRQARKILETPGLRTRNSRIQSACERYKNEGMAAPLEGLVEATKDLPQFDRSEIYYNLLETYCQVGNVDKALGLWTQMQDEDVHVSDEFLAKLGGFLKSKGLNVPFEIPNIVIDAPLKEKEEQSSDSSLTTAIRRKDVDAALQIKESIERTGTEISRFQMGKLLELLVEKGRLREATGLFTTLKENQIPSNSILNFFINKVSKAGELDMLQRIGENLSDEQKKQTSFVNRHFNCAVVAGKAKGELDKIENQIDSAVTADEVDALVSEFPRGGIYAVLESSPTYLEQVTRIVDKYYNKGATAPANCLCMFYLGNGQLDKAKEVYQHYNLANSSRLMFQYILNKARLSRKPELIEDLITLLKDAPAITPANKGSFYSNIIRIYLKKGEAETAYAKLQEAVQSVPIENLYVGTLTALKEELEAKNIPFQYTIPPRTKKSKESSSSSSSSDFEHESVASKN